MNINTLVVSTVASAVVFITSHATANSTLTPQPLGGVAVLGQFQPVAFSDSTEAGMLQNAYDILATGDHDYSGHRVKALHAVKVAAKTVSPSRCLMPNCAKPKVCSKTYLETLKS